MHARPGGRRQRERRPIRRAAALLAALSLLGACGGRGEAVADGPAPEPAPGLWERTSEVEAARGPNLPFEAQRRLLGPRPAQRICIAAGGRARLIAGPNCRELSAVVRDGRLHAAYACADALGPSEVTAAGTAAPASLDLALDIRNRLPGDTILTLSVRMRARRLGACPAAAN